MYRWSRSTTWTTAPNSRTLKSTKTLSSGSGSVLLKWPWWPVHRCCRWILKTKTKDRWKWWIGMVLWLMPRLLVTSWTPKRSGLSYSVLALLTGARLSMAIFNYSSLKARNNSCWMDTVPLLEKALSMTATLQSCWPLWKRSRTSRTAKYTSQKYQLWQKALRSSKRIVNWSWNSLTTSPSICSWVRSTAYSMLSPNLDKCTFTKSASVLRSINKECVNTLCS